MGKRMICGLGLVSLALCAAPAVAHDPSDWPDHGTVDLRGGFSPDPHVIEVQAGGGVSASRLGGDCIGEIGNSPDVVLEFEPGRLPLIISVESSVDTTLAIRTPRGAWVCDDDGGDRGSNPSIRFNRPARGRYAIFVGTYSNGGPEPARLHISEVHSQ